MTKTVIKLENISKKYCSLLALDNINLEVQNGEVVGLIGPNGAGKTTTLKLIAKLLRPNSGKILLRNIRGELQDINKNSKELVYLLLVLKEISRILCQLIKQNDFLKLDTYLEDHLCKQSELWKYFLVLHINNLYV